MLSVKASALKTMVVTTNIRLERMLLHSRATSTVKPGIVSRVPSSATGIPTAEKSRWADVTDPSCSSLTIGFSKNWE